MPPTPLKNNCCKNSVCGVLLGYGRKPGYCSPECRVTAELVRRGPDECWEWSGPKEKTGYGRFLVSGNKLILAHRASWQAANGRKVPKGLFVLHKCDNPPCCNPSHLFLGTIKDNVHDMHRKGRAQDYTKVPRYCQKLTPANVRRIRRLKYKMTAREIGKQHGVGPSAIHKIWENRSWKHITG